MTTEQILQVDGMTCGGCEASVRRGLLEIAGVEEVDADHEAKQVRVSFDPVRVEFGEIRTRIEELGFDVVS